MSWPRLGSNDRTPPKLDRNRWKRLQSKQCAFVLAARPLAALWKFVTFSCEAAKHKIRDSGWTFSGEAAKQKIRDSGWAASGQAARQDSGYTKVAAKGVHHAPHPHTPTPTYPRPRLYAHTHTDTHTHTHAHSQTNTHTHTHTHTYTNTRAPTPHTHTTEPPTTEEFTEETPKRHRKQREKVSGWAARKRGEVSGCAAI